jgi:hypothetical protein
MAQYRAAVIGLGWMGLLYDLAQRILNHFDIDDIDRPTPPLNIHRQFYYHEFLARRGVLHRMLNRCGTVPRLSWLLG